MFSSQPQIAAQLIAANGLSRHPVLGFITNLVDRFIVVQLRKHYKRQNSKAATGVKEPKYEMIFYDFDESKINFIIIIIFNTFTS